MNSSSHYACGFTVLMSSTYGEQFVDDCEWQLLSRAARNSLTGHSAAVGICCWTILRYYSCRSYTTPLLVQLYYLPKTLHLCRFYVVTDKVVVFTAITLVAAFSFATPAEFFCQTLVFVLFAILIIGCELFTLQLFVWDGNVVEIQEIGLGMVTEEQAKSGALSSR